MGLIKGIIDIVIVILLLRLLIKPREAFFNPFYGMVYRITDPILIPAGYVTRNATYGILLTILTLVVLRGGIYVPLGHVSFMSGIGISFLSLIKLLFQAFMAMWFISILSQHSFGASFTLLIERAFNPLDRILKQFGISRQNSRLFFFFFLLVLYSVCSTLIRYLIVPNAMFSPSIFLQGLGEGLALVVGLFTGFFSIVVIVGALLSWVSPDPSNPIVQAIYGISEPLLRPFRRVVPLLGGLDISPIIALFCFQILGNLALQIIQRVMRAI
ncbi:MAG: YggT family protein [Deltaproteobacteria bacterium]|nr:YggT family protein [Deltaproteobacteria bacterium]